jgi:hypothetical protein
MNRINLFAAGNDRHGLVQFAVDKAGAARFAQQFNDNAAMTGRNAHPLGVKELEFTMEQIVEMLNAMLILQLKERAAQEEAGRGKIIPN